MRQFAVMLPVVLAITAGTAITSAQAPVTPRVLSSEQLGRLRGAVQASKARSVADAEARRLEAERQREEQARQHAEMMRQFEESAARQAEEDAQADAEFEEERARKAAAWNAMAASNKRALDDSLRRLDNTVARVQMQHADAVARQREQAQVPGRAQGQLLDAAERRRQVGLINQATQRQTDEASRLSAQRFEAEMRRNDEQIRQQAAAERARLRQAAVEASRRPASGNQTAGLIIEAKPSSSQKAMATVPAAQVTRPGPSPTRPVDLGSTKSPCRLIGKKYYCPASAQ
jgi:hypothetical protein